MRIAVVGAGYWGVNLVRVFNQLGVLYKVCDFSPVRLQQLAGQYPDIPMEGSIEAVVDDQKVAGVGTPPPAETHYKIARRALLAGKDVFVEKPLTLRCEEAEQLTNLAESQGRILMVGHLLEFHPAIARLEELI